MSNRTLVLYYLLKNVCTVEAICACSGLDEYQVHYVLTDLQIEGIAYGNELGIYRLHKTD